MQVVTVKFQVKHSGSFREAILANAGSSLANEPGCRVFDVCEAAGGQFFLYEVYDDACAFDFHRTTGHFAKFDRASAPWITDKAIACYELVKNRVSR